METIKLLILNNALFVSPILLKLYSQPLFWLQNFMAGYLCKFFVQVSSFKNLILFVRSISTIMQIPHIMHCFEYEIPSLIDGELKRYEHSLFFGCIPQWLECITLYGDFGPSLRLSCLTIIFLQTTRNCMYWVKACACITWMYYKYIAKRALCPRCPT